MACLARAAHTAGDAGAADDDVDPSLEYVMPARELAALEEMLRREREREDGEWST